MCQRYTVSNVSGPGRTLGRAKLTFAYASGEFVMLHIVISDTETVLLSKVIILSDDRHGIFEVESGHFLQLSYMRNVNIFIIALPFIPCNIRSTVLRATSRSTGLWNTVINSAIPQC